MAKTLEEKRAYMREYKRQWRADHPLTEEQKAKDSARNKKWKAKDYKENKDDILIKIAEYHKTPRGRATYLLCNYNRMDKDRGLPHGDLTVDDVLEIIQQPCAHCGVSGWQVIGLNRLDNSKPHTRDNVEPCCRSCNSKLMVIALNEKKKVKKQEEEDLELLTKPNI